MAFDCRSCPGHSFAAGIILEKLRLYSPSEDDEDTGFLIPGVIKKKVKLQRFGIYWDFDQGACVTTKSASLLQECMIVPFQHPGEVSSSHSALIPRHFILEPISLQLRATIDTRAVELRKRCVDEVITEVIEELGWSEKIDQFHRITHAYRHIRKDGVRGRSANEEWELMEAYLMKKYEDQCTPQNMSQAKQFCMICWDRTNQAQPMVEVDGELDKFVLRLDQKQYRDILNFVSSLGTQALKAKYKKYRPSEEPDQDISF